MSFNTVRHYVSWGYSAWVPVELAETCKTELLALKFRSGNPNFTGEQKAGRVEISSTSLCGGHKSPLIDYWLQLKLREVIEVLIKYDATNLQLIETNTKMTRLTRTSFGAHHKGNRR